MFGFRCRLSARCGHTLCIINATLAVDTDFEEAELLGGLSLGGASLEVFGRALTRLEFVVHSMLENLTSVLL